MLPRISPARAAYAALLVCIRLQPCVAGDSPAIAMRVDNPRAFGHFVGDPLRREIDLTVPSPYRLVQNELPAPARVNAWMECTGATVRAMTVGAGIHYHLALTYQVVNSPTQVLTAALPSLELRFVGDGLSVATRLEEWPIVIAPLVTGGLREGLEAMRPARVPLRIDPTASQLRMAIFGAGASVLFTALALVRFGLPERWRRRGPFAAAQRVIRPLAALPASTAHRRTALRALHRAFDQTLGRRLFGEQCDDFVARHPEFYDLRDQARWFFAASRREFFGGGGADSDAGERPEAAALAALCAKFAACERRGRRAQPRTARGHPL